jgi:transmembrane sensor
MKPEPQDKYVSGMSPEEAAAHWLVRRETGDMGEDEAAAFEAWRGAAAGNVAEFARAENRWKIFDAVDDDRLIKAMRQAALQAPPERPRWHSYTLAAGVAAMAFALSMIISDGARFVGGDVADIRAAGAPDYVTKKGERLHANLPDGTIVTLNTATAIDVVFEGGRRGVRLLSGEAYFEVARNPDRQFTVAASGREITALGTAFNVRLDGNFEVTLIEGKVSVEEEPFGSQQAPTVTGGAGNDKAADPQPTVLTPGQRLVAAGTGIKVIEGIDVTRKLRWRDGFVELEAENLREAVSEFNRYSLTPIVIEDERVARLKISGVFRTAQPDSFVEIAEELLPIAVDRRGGKITLIWAGGDKP